MIQLETKQWQWSDQDFEFQFPVDERVLPKSQWGDGPWQNEPDKKQWLDEITGFPCLIHRGIIPGTLNGYVGIGEDSPLFGVDQEKINAETHGGITYVGYGYSTERPQVGISVELGADSIWWIGFDCAHAWDIMPAINALIRSFGREPLLFGSYKDIAYVEDRVRELARLLKAIEAIGKVGMEGKCANE